MKPIAALTAFAVLMQGQQAQPPAQQTSKPPLFAESVTKFSVGTNLVVINLDVRDKNGKPVEGLKASDFTLTEDDKAQKISIFEYQQLETEPLPAAEPEPAKPTAAPANAAPKPTAKPQITPSAPGQMRYKDRRLMVMFFDFSAMPQEDQICAQAAALKFVDTQITPADMVSIMTFATKLQVVEDFTADRDKLRATIKGFQIGTGSELAADGLTGADSEEDNNSAFTADESEFNVFNTDRKLSALESAAKMLGSLPEKKALVYFTSGVSKTGMENQSQLRATTNAAVKANVSFYPIDARGLVASAPGGDATKGSSRGSGMYSGSTQSGNRDKANGSQETLVTLAGDTGGKVMLDNNDLALGIQQAQKDVSSYYIVGYYSANEALDGRFRRIKVKFNDPKMTAKINYRSGYFAGKQFKNFSSSEKERQLEEAILLGDPMTELPIALEVNFFKMGKLSYFVPVAVKIPGSAMEVNKKGTDEKTELDFIGQIRDSKGKIQGSVRDMISVKLKGDEATSLTKRNLQYDSGFTLPPGDYTIKFLARENVSGKMGTFESKFTIPNLSTQTQWLNTSSVIWSNQREPMAASVASVEKNKKLMAAHPLIQDGQKLVPSITRVYRTNQNLYVYTEVYDAVLEPGSKKPDVMASLSFFQGKVKTFQTGQVRVQAVSATRNHMVPVRFEIPLAGLKPGNYTCQVNLVDEVGQKFAFSRSPMVLVK